MRTKSAVFGVTCLVFLVLLAGCYQPGGPIPEGSSNPPIARDYTQADVDKVVVMEEQAIPAPLPAEWGAPAECDEIRFLRFRLIDGSTLGLTNKAQINEDKTDAVLLMLPGVLEGANGFEYIGRQLVYEAKVKDGKNFEVWAVERRNNRLADLNGLNYLEDQLSNGNMDITEAVNAFKGYYDEGQAINGKIFQGFLANQDLPFLANFGLKLDTEDVFKVIQTLVPDQAVRKKKVFVGGHSMGGMMTSNFVGWDLDGNPATTDDAGYNNCAGMFGLDTVVNSISGIGDSIIGMIPDVMKPGVLDMTESIYGGIVDGLKDGAYPVVLNSGPLFPAESMALLEAVGMAAYYDPNGEDTYISDIPWADNTDLLIRFMSSADYDIFLQNSPNLRDYRLTNQALFGLLFDDSFAPVGMILNSMGFLTGGPVIKKDFPQWPIGAIPGLSQSIGNGPYYMPNDAGPADNLGTGPLYSWVNFDQIGNSSDPDYHDTTGETTFTTMQNEMTDVNDVARALFKGPLNLTEWYFSTRLLADLFAGALPWAPKYGLNFLHGDKLVDMPQVVFIAGQGMMANMDISGLPGEKHLLEGYNHMDPMMASANTSARRPNEVIQPLIDFVLRNTK
jgi:pimeloyl-ACP methyl ester carboxylesterase